MAPVVVRLCAFFEPTRGEDPPRPLQGKQVGRLLFVLIVLLESRLE
jgi:hypothetical protein